MIFYLKKYAPRALPAVLFLLPVAVLLFVLRDEVFFGGFFSNGDTVLAALPFLFYHAHNGSIIVQGMYSGYPLFVSINAAWFYPVATFLFSHLQATTAYLVLDIGSVVLAYIFTYLYARIIRLGVAASILAAAVFVFSGQLMLWVPATTMTGYYFLLPAVLYLFELALEKPFWLRTAMLVALGVLLGDGWISAHVQFVVYIHALYLVYVPVRLLFIGKARDWGNTVYALLLPYTVSFVIGLPQIWAVLTFQHETLRSAGVSFAAAVESGYRPWDLVHYLLPFWNVSFFPINAPNLYIGILPLLLLLIALFSYRSIKNPYTIFFMGIFLFCLAAAVDYSPLGAVLHYLPLWNSFRDATRIMFIGGFAEAMLVGIGFEYLYTNWESLAFYDLRTLRIFKILFVYIALPVVVVFTLVRAFFFDAIQQRLEQYFFAHQYAQTTQLPKEHYATIIGTYLHQALDQFSLFDPQMIFALLFSACALLLFKFQKKLPAASLGLVVIGITCINMAFVFAQYYPSVPAAGVYALPHTVQTMQALQKDNPAPFRVFPILPAQGIYNDMVACPLSEEDVVQMQNELLEANSNLYFGIDSVEGYDNYLPSIASKGLEYIGSQSTQEPDPLFFARIPLDQKIGIILARKNVLRAMNIKYITSAIPLSDPALQLVDTVTVGTCKHPVYMYSLAGTWPRYFVTNSAVLSKVADTGDASSTLSELNHYATPTVLFDSSVSLLPAEGKPQTAEVLPTLGENTIKFETPECDGSCALFIGNTYLQDWSATLDGKPATILRANYQYMALVLPPGAHTAVLTYKKPL